MPCQCTDVGSASWLTTVIAVRSPRVTAITGPGDVALAVLSVESPAREEVAERRFGAVRLVDFLHDEAASASPASTRGIARGRRAAADAP